MTAGPLSVGHGSEEHDDHEELGEFHGAAEGPGKEIAEQNVQRGDEHHEQEEEHAEGAGFLAHGFQMLQNVDACAQRRQTGGPGGEVGC